LQAVNNRGTPHILASILSQWHCCQQQHSSRHADKPQQPQQPPQQQQAPVLPQQHMQQVPSQGATAGSLLLAAGKATVAANQEAAGEQHTAADTSISPLLHKQHGSSQGRVLQQGQQQCSRTAVLLQIPLTGFLHCSTFGELFDWLLRHQGMLCCALYRHAAENGSNVWYTYTNPHKDTLLRASDRAFVLAAVQPGSPLQAVG
jgi:hypothetical protein